MEPLRFSLFTEISAVSRNAGLARVDRLLKLQRIAGAGPDSGDVPLCGGVSQGGYKVLHPLGQPPEYGWPVRIGSSRRCF